jgi:hypothetical protein
VATQRTHRIVIATVVGLFVVGFAVVYLRPQQVQHPVTADAAFLAQVHLEPSGLAAGHSDASLLAAAHAICAALATGDTSPTLPPDFSAYQITLLPGGQLNATGGATDNAGEMAIDLVTDAEFNICPLPSLTP